jgi:hypothetical protein
VNDNKVALRALARAQVDNLKILNKAVQAEFDNEDEPRIFGPQPVIGQPAPDSGAIMCFMRWTKIVGAP